MWAVTATSSPDGTAASTIHTSTFRQVGGVASSAPGASIADTLLEDRRSSMPQAAISTRSTPKPIDQYNACSPSRMNGSIAAGYDISARTLPKLLAAYRKYGSFAAG